MNIHLNILIHFTVDGHLSSLGSLSIKKWAFWYMSFGAHRHTFLFYLVLQSPSAVILEPPRIKSATVSTFPHLFTMK